MIFSIIISVLFFVHIFFLFALVRKNFAVIDIGWGLGIILIAIVSYLHNPLSIKNAVLLMMVVIWGVRLALYIFARSRGKGEDSRYTHFREMWQPHPNIHAYFKVFIGQGILMVVVSLPVSTAMATSAAELSVLNWLGILIWGLGLTFEIWADSYMAWWKSRPEHRGSICTTGPWKFCRFPNYFGEASVWYGIYLAGFSLNSSWSILGPLTINFLLLKVTGVPPLERSLIKRPGYEEYARRVPRFVPFTRP